MKKNKKLTHAFFYLIILSSLSNLLYSCGTEEDPIGESVTLSANTNSILIGEEIVFSLASNTSGDVTGEATYFINGQPIDGNSFIGVEVSEGNEAYARYNGLVSNKIHFNVVDQVVSQFTQKVLVEDYTGTWCGYCPRMATILDHLTSYSDRIIPVAIHCPGLPADPWTYEFASEMVKPNNYNAGGQPKGKINRIYDLNQFQLEYNCPSNDPSVYTSQMDSYLNQSAPLGLAINSTRNGNNLEMTVKVGFAIDELPQARLVVNLIEEDLVYSQANYLANSNYDNCIYNSGAYNVNPIPAFPQKHILLKSYTDIFGDIIPQNEIVSGGVYTKTFNVPLPPNVTNPDNLKIVAFVLGNGNEVKNRPVINVQQANVGQDQPFD